MKVFASFSPLPLNINSRSNDVKGNGFPVVQAPKLGNVADVFVKSRAENEVKPRVKLKQTPISFGYKNILKTLWKAGDLPSVTKGFYGGTLTKGNVSLEHLQCASKGGKTNLSNLVLATKENNNIRGNSPLKDFFNPEKMAEYLKQFVGVKTEGFDGDKYIEGITKKVDELL